MIKRVDQLLTFVFYYSNVSIVNGMHPANSGIFALQVRPFRFRKHWRLECSLTFLLLLFFLFYYCYYYYYYYCYCYDFKFITVMCLSHIATLLLLILLLSVRSDLECNLILKLSTKKVLKSMTLGNNTVTLGNNNNNYYYYYFF